MSWRSGDALAFNDAVHGRSPSDAEIAALVASAERICELAARLEPAPAFAASLRTSLTAEAAIVLAWSATSPPVARTASGWIRITPQRRHLLAIVLTTVLAAMGTVGVTAKRAKSKPDQDTHSGQN
jgi:hypothetical protein